MEPSLEQYNQIQRYLNNEMDTNEVSQFLSVVEQNHDLKEALLLEYNLRESSFMLEKNEDYEKIKAIAHAAKSEWQSGVSESGKTINIRKLIGIAASVVLIISVSYFIFRKESNPPVNIPVTKNNSAESTNNTLSTTRPPKEFSSDELFLKYYAKENAPEKQPLIIAALLDDYNKNKYKSLQQLDLSGDQIGIKGGQEKIFETLYYYKGISFMETNKLQDARKQFDWLITHSVNSMYKLNSLWFMALIEIKQKETTPALKYLEEIRKHPEATYFQKATELKNILSPGR